MMEWQLFRICKRLHVSSIRPAVLVDFDQEQNVVLSTLCTKLDSQAQN